MYLLSCVKWNNLRCLLEFPLSVEARRDMGMYPLTTKNGTLDRVLDTNMVCLLSSGR
jgi:hypothetical protein